MSRVLVCSMVASVLATAALAAEGASSPRNEVQQLVRAYVDAQIKPDATAVLDVGEIQVHGALTLVVEKSGRAWKVLHEHSSVEIPNT